MTIATDGIQTVSNAKPRPDEYEPDVDDRERALRLLNGLSERVPTAPGIKEPWQVIGLRQIISRRIK